MSVVMVKKMVEHDGHGHDHDDISDINGDADALIIMMIMIMLFGDYSAPNIDLLKVIWRQNMIQ